MRFLRQIGHLLALLLSIHRTRPRDSLLMAAGFIITTAALAVMLAIPAGIERIAGETGQRDIALAISASAMGNEDSSALNNEQVAILSSLPQIARDENNLPLVAPQFLANAKLTQVDGQRNTVLMRGVTDAVWALLDPALVRADAHPSGRQILASQTLKEQFVELNEPEVKLQNRQWQVVGTLDASGNLWESEIWTDLPALQAAYNRTGRVSSLWMKLASSEQMEALRQAVKDDPRLQEVQVMRQTDFYRGKVSIISDFARFAAIGVSVLLGAGAILAISTTLGMTLDKRRRDMATLRALGFDHLAVGVATLLDVLIIGVTATLLTALVVHALMDGVSFGTSSGNYAVYARFSVGTQVMLSVLAYSLLLGVLSTAFPLRKIIGGKLADRLKDD